MGRRVGLAPRGGLRLLKRSRMKRFFLIVQYLFFCVFFGIGAGAIALSIWIDPELTTYYSNKRYLDNTRQENEVLVSLTEQYQAQIDLINREPNVLGRLESLTFGQKPSTDEQTAVPTADSGDLLEAARVVLEEMRQPEEEVTIPQWMERCSQEKFRKALFASGAGLILISFIFFGSPKPQKATEPTPKKNYFSYNSGTKR